ncbi:heat shock factor-binding 1 family protein [Aspergillus brunneoviolaceus CBS 621.78]|uniref:Uncharacterized protein n=1 Tax=Aspergillus brunneoviolaceus CBS 621.78 TaxID=1450534 RepID=A0ACD1G963_9EURO|nr:hypothetical protein BO95DRAFT_442678 [Aspergillus brunneoviolaceus CBS 621.78]RAH45789.1 hypothetical protein BO95DRAFT_442678 [Aspergillus brunneoviolaceus CBS 621.78]
MTEETKSLPPPPPPPPPPATTLSPQPTTTTQTPPTTSTPTPAPEIQSELNAAVDDLLDQLQHKFDGVSREIFGKLDDMARRLDELEASLALLDSSAPAGAGATAEGGGGGGGAVAGAAGDAAGSASPGK